MRKWYATSRVLSVCHSRGFTRRGRSLPYSNLRAQITNHVPPLSTKSHSSGLLLHEQGRYLLHELACSCEAQTTTVLRPRFLAVQRPHNHLQEGICVFGPSTAYGFTKVVSRCARQPRCWPDVLVDRGMGPTADTKDLTRWARLTRSNLSPHVTGLCCQNSRPSFSWSKLLIPPWSELPAAHASKNDWNIQ